MASRAKSINELKIKTGKNTPDGVIIYSRLWERETECISTSVQIRNRRIYLRIPGRSGRTERRIPWGCSKRNVRGNRTEIHTSESRSCIWETLFHNGWHDRWILRQLFTDNAEGEISKDAQEDTEEIEVVLADREEVKRILREENVAIMCAYQLMHFLQDEDPFAFLKEEL